jgi:hypothetical protein
MRHIRNIFRKVTPEQRKYLDSLADKAIVIKDYQYLEAEVKANSYDEMRIIADRLMFNYLTEKSVSILFALINTNNISTATCFPTVSHFLVNRYNEVEMKLFMKQTYEQKKIRSGGKYFTTQKTKELYFKAAREYLSLCDKMRF